MGPSAEDAGSPPAQSGWRSKAAVGAVDRLVERLTYDCSLGNKLAHPILRFSAKLHPTEQSLGYLCRQQPDFLGHYLPSQQTWHLSLETLGQT